MDYVDGRYFFLFCRIILARHKRNYKWLSIICDKPSSIYSSSLVITGLQIVHFAARKLTDISNESTGHIFV